jgi:hypothetical protein
MVCCWSGSYPHGKRVNMPDEQTIKKLDALRRPDFDAHPIWTWHDSDEDEVRPLPCDGNFAEAQDSLFAASTFTLTDSSTVSGIVALRAHDHSIYLLEFWQADDTLLLCSLQPAAKDRFPVDTLESLLGRKIDDILPLTYSTQCAFGDVPLTGIVPRDVAPKWLFPELKKWADTHK